MDFEEIKTKISEYRSQGKKIFVTSSFQTHSIPLLHMISLIDKSIPIAFINTGFLFAETVAFKDKICDLFDLNCLNIMSLVPRSQQRDSNNMFYFASDPDRCCFINKTQPLEPLLIEYDVWINGIRSDQNSNRKKMKIEEKAPHNCLRFHPVIDWTAKRIYNYISEHTLPENPLDAQGYLSVGCEPCTRKFDINDERSARWFGMSKTECGLHTELVEK